MRRSRITGHFVALVASAFAASEGSAQDARFDVRPALAATGSLDAVTVADIDGDGDSDVVATDTATGRIVWIENDSDVDPAFPIEHVIASGVIAPGEVAAADLDGDGDVDVAAAGSAATADLLWFENLGGVPPKFMARTLGPRPNLNTSGIVRSVTVADLHGDGSLDLVCGFELPNAAASGHVTVYLNNGASPAGFIRFQLPSPAALLSEVTGVAVADISGDGALDVVACSRDTTAGSDANSVVSWRNTGVGGTGFVPSIIASQLGEPAAVAVAQLSTDALPDIAVATQGAGRVFVFENNQAAPGTFLSPLPLLAVDIVDLAARDLVGSPRPDLVAITSQGPVLFENQGGPVLSFAATTIEAGVGSFDSVAIGPIDDDADNDIVVAGPGGARWIERVTPVENTTNGSVHSSLADAVSNVSSGDVLRATPEYFVPNLTLPPALASYELESTGSLVIGPRADAAFGSDARLRPAQGFVARLSGPVDLAPGTVLEIESQTPVEVTASQDLDSAKLVAPASALQLKLSPDWTPEEIDGAFSSGPTPLSLEPRDAQFFDPSIDGSPAIVVVSEVIGGGGSQQPGTLSVYTQSGVSPTGWVAMPVDGGQTGVHRSVAVGDVNNDGADDIVSVFEPATGGLAVLRLHVSDGESPPSFTSIGVAPAVADGAQVVFDLDRDGLADIVTPTGYYRQAAPQTFAFVSFPLVGGDQGIGVSIARLDPDFEPDVVVHTAVLADLPPRRVGFRLTALQSDGVGGFTPVIIDSLDRTGDAACIDDCYPSTNAAFVNKNTLTTADFDHDGDDDVVFSEDQGLVIYENASGVFLPTLVEPDLRWDESVATDADGNRTLDLVVASTRRSAVIGITDPLLASSHRVELARPYDRAATIDTGDVDGDDDDDLIIAGSAFDRLTLLRRNPLESLTLIGSAAELSSPSMIDLRHGGLSLQGSTVDAGGDLRIGQQGVLQGDGAVVGTVFNAGTLRPRPSLSIFGSYAQFDIVDQSNAGSLDVLLPTAGPDPLIVAHNAAYAGELRVETMPGVVLGSGPRRIVTSQAVDPGFDRFDAALVPQLDIDVGSSAQSGTAAVNYGQGPSGAFVEVAPLPYSDPPLARSDFPSLGVPSDAVIGDIGGGAEGGPDGIPDLVIAYPELRDGGTGGVAVLLGDQTESGCRFLPLGVYEGKFADGPIAVEIADVDGNGAPEIVFANRGGSQLSRFVSVLDVDSTSATPITDSQLAPLLLRGDRVVTDLAVISLADPSPGGRGPQPATVLALSSGGIAGTVTAATYQVAIDSWEVCDIDVCDDPDSFDPIDPDGVALTLGEGFTSTSTDDDKVVVASNTGGMPDSFPKENFDAGQNPTAIRAADLTNDGFPDIAAINETSGTVSVFVNVADPGGPGGRSFAEGTQWSLRSDPGDPDPLPSSLALADLDDDGDLDIAVVSTDGDGDRAVRSLVNLVVETGGVSFTLPENLPEQPVDTPVIVREFDAEATGGGVMLNDNLVVLTVAEAGGLRGSMARNGTSMNAIICSEAAGCLPDVNGDGLLTPGDFNAWVLAYNTGLPSADQNGDGFITPGDFNAWVLNYNTGCYDR